MMPGSSVIVERIGSLTPELSAWLEFDPVRNAYPLDYAGRDPDRVELLAAKLDGAIRGHLFVYDSHEMGIKWAYLRGDKVAVETLLSRLPRGRVVVNTEPELVSIVKARSDFTEADIDHIMVVVRGEQRLVDSTSAVRLGPEHAEAYCRFANPDSPTVTPGEMEMHRRLLREEVVYGIFAEDGTIASVASSNCRSQVVWVLSGVETLPQHRGHGFTAKVCSAVTRIGLMEAPRVVLFVNAANLQAIRLYSRLGYRKAGENAVLEIRSGE